jgi:hypothetical protein
MYRENTGITKEDINLLGKVKKWPEVSLKSFLHNPEVGDEYVGIWGPYNKVIIKELDVTFGGDKYIKCQHKNDPKFVFLSEFNYFKKRYEWIENVK